MSIQSPAGPAWSFEPPPLPPVPRASTVLASAKIPGTQGLTDEEIAGEISGGGRFVRYPWCFSFGIMTLRRASEVYFLRKDDDGFGAAFGYSLISLIFGWWSIPWGPLETVICLFQSAKGGKDVTGEVLSNVFGNSLAAQILHNVPKRRMKPRMWLLLGALFLMPFLLIAGVFTVVSSDSEWADSRDKTFKKAEAFVAIRKDVSANGNTQSARHVAEEISAKLKATTPGLLGESARYRPRSQTEGDFLIWCEMRDGKAILLIHVPGLRNFDADLKQRVARAAWDAGVAEIEKLPPTERPAILAVATRGVVRYDRLMIGSIRTEDQRPVRGSDPSETVEGFAKISQRLNELFKPVEVQGPTP